MNINTELSAETLALIYAICEKGNTPLERENTKQLILEILLHKHKLISLDMNDIKQFQGGGKVTAFEVVVDALNEVRMKQLVALISQKCESASTFCKMLIMFICPLDNVLKINEMNGLTDLCRKFDNTVQCIWGIAMEEQVCTTSKLRAIVIIQNENWII